MTLPAMCKYVDISRDLKILPWVFVGPFEWDWRKTVQEPAQQHVTELILALALSAKGPVLSKHGSWFFTVALHLAS